MPPTNTTGQTNEISFLGLQSYTEAQSSLFFGRDAEIDAVTSLVELNTLTIVFGRSGTGKTSLLNAGVFPKLRKSFCLPFRIRLEFNDNSPDLITQIKKILKEEIDKYGFKVDSYPSSETLWEYFHKEPLWKTVTPILVFDQFEEIFTLARSNPRFASVELPLFWEELSNLIENNIPEKLKPKFLEQKEKIEYNYKKQKAKIVFAFREEYLPEFESITSKIPSLKYSRFRLLPMNGDQAYEVITRSWKQNIDKSEARHLVSYFTNEQGIDNYKLITVEPSLLSQVCAYIDRGRIESGGGKVSSELLRKYPKETILRSIYDEAVLTANSSLKQDAEKNDNRNYIKEFVEDKLITSEGYRNKYNLSGNDETLRPGINILTAKYFIREDDNAVELTHDVLAPIIKSDREKRRKETAQAIFRKRAKRLIIGAALLAIVLIGYSLIQSKVVLDNMETKLKGKRAELGLIRDSVANARKIIERPNPNPNPPKPISKEIIKLVTQYIHDTTFLNDPDSVIFRLTQFIIKLEGDNDRLNKDLENAGTKNANIEAEIRKLIKRIGQLESDDAKNKQAIKELNDQVKSLKNDLVKANERIRILQDSIKYLWGTIRNLSERLNPPPGPSINPGNLRIQVYDKSGEFKTPITKDTFLVYIIPNKGTNKVVLEKNKNILLTKDCEGFNKLLPDLGGWQKAYFKDGYYYFHDVIQNGKYKVKICNVLDGYFNLTMPSPSGFVFWKQTGDQKVAIKLGKF